MMVQLFEYKQEQGSFIGLHNYFHIPSLVLTGF